MAPEAITIDVISDVMCPWCFIGKRNLEAALAKLDSTYPVDVRWLPFQLDATLPPQGKDRRRYLEDKFGGPEGAARVYSNIARAGAQAGIAFDFDAIAVSPNTRKAHKLIALAESGSLALQNEIVEHLFTAFFLEGRNIGADDVLSDIANDVAPDLPMEMVLEDGNDLSDHVDKLLAIAPQMGVGGVPVFIINRRQALQGAQPSDVIVDTIRATMKDPTAS